MKTRLTLLLLVLSCLVPLIAVVAQPAPRADQWKQVDDAVRKGLPKTAIERLEPIIKSALKDEAWAEAINAIGRRIALEGNIQGNKPEEKV